jgi:hypothetical protein
MIRVVLLKYVKQIVTRIQNPTQALSQGLNPPPKVDSGCLFLATDKMHYLTDSVSAMSVFINIFWKGLFFSNCLEALRPLSSALDNYNLYWSMTNMSIQSKDVFDRVYKSWCEIIFHITYLLLNKNYIPPCIRV